jgi:phosphoglucomutase
MDAAVKSKIDTWLKGNYDDETKLAIKKLQSENNDTELTESFYKNLESCYCTR